MTRCVLYLTRYQGVQEAAREEVILLLAARNEFAFGSPFYSDLRNALQLLKSATEKYFFFSVVTV